MRTSRGRFAGLRPGNSYLFPVLDGGGGRVGSLDRAARCDFTGGILRRIALNLNFCDGTVVAATAVASNQVVVWLFVYHMNCQQMWIDGRTKNEIGDLLYALGLTLRDV